VAGAADALALATVAAVGVGATAVAVGGGVLAAEAQPDTAITVARTRPAFWNRVLCAMSKFSSC